MIERELHAHQRAALRAWAARDVPDDFAEEVLARWDAEQEADRSSAAAPGREQPRADTRAERRDARLAWWCGVMAAAAAIVLALGMAWPRAVQDDRPRPDPTAFVERDAPTPELAMLREQARAQLLVHCTPCHLGRAEGAKPPAVAIFDVGQARWHDGLTGAQLVAAASRMDDRASVEEAAGFRRYVDAELAHRSTAAR